jgi:hypothetical protein
MNTLDDLLFYDYIMVYKYILKLLINRGKRENIIMDNKTISIDSSVGQRLDMVTTKSETHLVFMGKGISLTGKVTIGRDEKNDIVLDGNLISRFHAEVHRIGDDYFIKDLDSSNGTYVNQEPVPRDKYVKLKDNDIIRFGNYEITLVKSDNPDVIKSK